VGEFSVTNAIGKWTVRGHKNGNQVSVKCRNTGRLGKRVRFEKGTRTLGLANIQLSLDNC